MRQAVAKAQPKQQQRTIVRKTERVGGRGGEGADRVLMTIELEMTRKNGEEGPGGERGTGRFRPLDLLTYLANQLTFK